MMSIMMNTIERAIRPLFLTCRVLNLNVYTSKPYLSILYNLIVWCAYSYIYYYIAFAFKQEKWFLSTSTLINIVIDLLVSITSIICLHQYNRLRKFIKRLAAIDDTLEELGTPKMYQKLHIRIKTILIIWLICSQIANTCDIPYLCHTSQTQWCMLSPYIMNHHLHANMFVNLIFTIFLWYIGTRFDKLNKHIRCLLLREEHDIRYIWRKIVPTHRYIMHINNYKRVLWIIMHLYLELCQLTRELNAIFEIQITMEMLASLTYLTKMLRYMYIHLTSNDNFISSVPDWIQICVWVSLYIARLFWTNYVCESVCAKSNEINIIIHRLTDVSQYADIRKEIYQFTLQIIHHPLKLSGLGLFDFGNGFLRKFVVTILTFLIIIIQMSGASKTFTY